MNELLRNAVLQQRRLRISYEPGERIVEPHAYGYGSDGQLLLRVYQTEGASASGEHEHWKLFRGDRIAWVELEGSTFDEPRDGYREGDKAMRGGIIAQVLLRNRKARA